MCRGGELMEIIYFEPVFQEKIWGGSLLESHFGYQIPSNQTGEAWVISAHRNGVTKVVNHSQYSGVRLDDLYRDQQELFGYPKKPKFPLLVKIIDAHDDLSVQVHPDDLYAMKNETKELGKSECWYILHAEPGAEIVYGHHAQNVEEYDQFIKAGDFDKFLRKIKVKKGDFLEVTPGTVHSIGAGIVLLEIQQSSDTTYRIYDFDRLDNSGNKRELHLDKARDVIQFPHQDSPYNRPNIAERNTNTALVKNDKFTIYHGIINGQLDIDLHKDKYYLGNVIEGSGELVINGLSNKITIGEAFIVPYGDKTTTVKGNVELILSHPN